MFIRRWYDVDDEVMEEARSDGMAGGGGSFRERATEPTCFPLWCIAKPRQPRAQSTTNHQLPTRWLDLLFFVLAVLTRGRRL